MLWCQHSLGFNNCEAKLPFIWCAFSGDLHTIDNLFIFIVLSEVFECISGRPCLIVVLPHASDRPFVFYKVARGDRAPEWDKHTTCFFPLSKNRTDSERQTWFCLPPHDALAVRFASRIHHALIPFSSQMPEQDMAWLEIWAKAVVHASTSDQSERDAEEDSPIYSGSADVSQDGRKVEGIQARRKAMKADVRKRYAFSTTATLWAEEVTRGLGTAALE